MALEYAALAQTYPALARLDAHLDANAGRLGEADAAIAVAALEEYMAANAQLGRGLRELTARFRPTDETGAMLAYLYIITVDAATHDGRDAALGAYATSGKPLSEAAQRLYARLTSDEFRLAVGRRPIQGGQRGCASN
jgi:hypothetical protein